VTPEATRVLRKLQNLPSARLGDRCSMCNAALVPSHDHLLDGRDERVLCCCHACGVLFDGHDGRYRAVHSTGRKISDPFTDEEWSELGVPVRLACIVRRGTNVVALYPGPAGIAEHTVPAEPWQSLSRKHPVVAEIDGMRALVSCRFPDARATYLVSADLCYAFVGELRRAGSWSSAGVRCAFERLFGCSSSLPEDCGGSA
jgi:hypothetical protein